MKKVHLLLLATFVLLASCLKQEVKKTYTLYYPIHKTRQEVRDAVSTQAPHVMSNLGNFALYNTYIFINERELGVHIVNRDETGKPQVIGFIPIPGNQGVAIRNNMLYADCYSDLFVIDISNINEVKLHAVRENIFLSRWSPHGMNDSNKVVVDWIKKDTTVTQDYVDMGNGRFFMEDMFTTGALNTAASGGSNSVGSSMAVFTLVNQYLYAVDRSNLYSFDVKTPSDPTLVHSTYINWNVETIFPFKDKLFLGTRTGMYIYSLSSPASPTYMSVFTHANVCDPVIADDQHAYVTLRSGTACNGFTNQLDVLDITNPLSPSLLKTYPLHNPHGLSKDNHMLFVCDGAKGIKVFDAQNPMDIKLKKTLDVGNAVDIIASQGYAIAITNKSLLFYKYTPDFVITETGILSIQ